jgi:hypothetical protein
MADLTRPGRGRARAAGRVGRAGGWPVAALAAGLLTLALGGCGAVAMVAGTTSSAPPPPSTSTTTGQGNLDDVAAKIADQMSTPVSRVRAALDALAARRHDTDLAALGSDVANLVDDAAQDPTTLDRPKDRHDDPWPKVCAAATTALNSPEMDGFSQAAKSIPPIVQTAYPSGPKGSTDRSDVTDALVIASLRAHSSQLVVDLGDPDVDSATLHATITLLFTQAQACP